MSATARAKKDKVIWELAETRRQILDAASSLSPEKHAEIFLGIWSVKDLLAHLAGWDFTNLQAAKEILAGNLPSFYAQYDRDWKTYNAHLVTKYKKDSFADLLTLVEDSHRRLIEFLKTIAVEEFDKDRGLRWQGYEITIASLLQVEVNDEKTHSSQVKQLGHA